VAISGDLRNADGTVAGTCATHSMPVAQEIRACAACHLRGTEHMKCNLCRVTFYCSVECQRSDYKQHKKFVCVSHSRQQSNCSVQHIAVEFDGGSAHPHDTRGILAEQTDKSLRMFSEAMRMPCATEADVRQRVHTCNDIVHAQRKTAGMWKKKRMALKNPSSVQERRWINEYYKKQAIELMSSHHICMSLGQRQRALEIQSRANELLLCIEQESFADDFGFETCLGCFTANVHLGALMIAIDDASAEFHKQIFRMNRYIKRASEWTAFVFSRLDCQILKNTYAHLERVYDMWQHERMNAVDENSAMDTPVDLDLFLFAISECLQQNESMLFHLRRSQKREPSYQADPLLHSVYKVVRALWKRYKQKASCVCLPEMHCDDCVDGFCVNGSGRNSANMFLYSRATDTQLCSLGRHPDPRQQILFMCEMRKAGVLRAPCKTRRVRVFWTPLRGLAACIRLPYQDNTQL